MPACLRAWLWFWLAGLPRNGDFSLGKKNFSRSGGMGENHGGHKGIVTPDSDTDRKSTRLNSSHLGISYAVFCLKKKKNTHINAYRSYHQRAPDSTSTRSSSL